MEFLQLVANSPSITALLGVIISSLLTFTFGLKLLKYKKEDEKENRNIELKTKNYGDILRWTKRTADYAETVILSYNRNPENYLHNPLNEEIEKKFTDAMMKLCDAYDQNTIIISEKFENRYNKMVEAIPEFGSFKPLCSEKEIVKSFREGFVDLREIARDETGTQMNLK